MAAWTLWPHRKTRFSLATVLAPIRCRTPPWLQGAHNAQHFLPSGSGSNPQRPRQVAVGYTHIFSPTVLNEFHYGYSRSYYGYSQPGFGINMAQQIGIANANTDPLLGGYPIIGGWYGNMAYVGDGGPYLVLEPAQQFNDAVTWTKGKHIFKFGGTILHRDVNWTQGNNAKGYFWIDDGNYGDAQRRPRAMERSPVLRSPSCWPGLWAATRGRLPWLLRHSKLGKRLFRTRRLACE